MTTPYDPTSPPWPHSSDDSSDTEYPLLPTTIEAWMHRPPAFTFADSARTMLVWDTEEGGGIITKHSIGKLPLRHSEAVITMLMTTIDTLTQKEGPSKQRRMV
jgi:hypothetical protein